MANADELRERLAEYDGRNTTILSGISAKYRSVTGFPTTLVTLADDEEPTISEGATWLLKVALEDGCALPLQDVERLATRLNDVKAWQAQLHICQSIQYLVVPKELEQSIMIWLGKMLDSPRPLLRAWSMDAYCRLSAGNSPNTKTLLNRMESDDAASVRARVRNLKREFNIG